jgi:hypothetical protein
MECLYNGKACFLAEEEWAEVAREQFNQCVPDYLHNLFQDFSNYMARLPELLRDGFDIRAAIKLGKPIPFSDDDVSSLTNRSLELYDLFRKWGVRFMSIVPFPKEALSPTRDELYPVIFRYESPSAATVYCAYWACLIMLQEILNACGCLLDNKIPDVELVDNICKSVEYNGAGTWGPYRMGFSLRVAWEPANTEVKKWIVTWHERFNKFYAATSPLSMPTLEESYSPTQTSNRILAS